MKVLIVTSRLTFVPDNYIGFLETLLAHSAEHIAGLVLVDNMSAATLCRIPALGILGAPRLAGVMARNTLLAPLRRRERLFEKLGLPVFVLPSINHPRALELVASLKIDLIVNSRSRDIYKSPILEAPRLGCINVHHGLLPEERGVMCDLFALSEGRPAGFTIHVMTPKLDDGPILVRREVSVAGEQNFVSYIDRGSRVEGETMSELLHTIEKDGKIPTGISNTSDKKIYRKLAGNRDQIRQFRQKGILL